MSLVSEIELFNLLKSKIGENEAKTLVEYVENKIETQTNKKSDENLKILATKQDIAETKEQINATKAQIAETKAELLKWMIVLFAPFYVGMIVFLIKQFLWQ